MAFSKIIAESMDLTDSYNFTGTLQQNGSSIGGVNTPFFHAYMGANQTVASNTTTIVQFNTERWDTASGFDTSAYSYTIPSGQGGYWIMKFKILFRLNNTYRQAGYFVVNGSNREGLQTHHQTTDNGFILTAQMNLSASDVIKTSMYQDRGGDETLLGDPIFSEFSGFKLIE